MTVPSLIFAASFSDTWEFHKNSVCPSGTLRKPFTDNYRNVGGDIQTVKIDD